ncbi:MAG: DNA-directed RNA polymerase subunit alpha [Elusimicrobiota bacterium]|jgi:DNA-directed RNA polymerase subunit alpha|nr:DNA-directed RNA polymerase subunit alpha [Elusimicrobiota bacterium]
MKDLAKLRTLTLDEKTATPYYGRFTAEPFESGYGHTIGNSLCRVLLSSIPGSAISAIKVATALHEFATLKGVKEDVARIILNLKKVRVKLHTGLSDKLYLKVSKAGKITAADITPNANVEVMNPDQEIANLDSGATLEIEMDVTAGIGYVLADESQASKYPVGTILLDCLYSPVVKVNYEVENTRVEQTLNYDRIVLEIWTDGSVSPMDALHDAALTLRSALSIFIGEKETPSHQIAKESEGEAEENDDKTEPIDRPLSALNLSTKAMNSLKKIKVKTTKELVALSESQLDSFTNFSKKTIEDIKDKLGKVGLALADDANEDGSN